jgi:hypothetical protein
VERRRDLLAAYDSHLRHGPADDVGFQEASDWLMTRLHEIKGIIDSANRLISDSAQRSFGPVGQAGDPDLIITTATQLGDLLETTLRWAQRVERVRIAPPFDEVSPEMAMVTDQTIERLRMFPREALVQIEEALRQPRSATPVNVDMTLVLKMSNSQRLHDAIDLANLRIKAGDFSA